MVTTETIFVYFIQKHFFNHDTIMNAADDALKVHFFIWFFLSQLDTITRSFNLYRKEENKLGS